MERKTVFNNWSRTIKILYVTFAGIICGGFLLACGGSANLEGQSPDLEGGVNLGEYSENLEGTNEEEEEIVAQPPVIISGSFLTCSYYQEEGSDSSTIGCSIAKEHLDDNLIPENISGISIDGQIFEISLAKHGSKNLVFKMRAKKEKLQQLKKKAAKVTKVDSLKEIEDFYDEVSDSEENVEDENKDDDENNNEKNKDDDENKDDENKDDENKDDENKDDKNKDDDENNDDDESNDDDEKDDETDIPSFNLGSTSFRTLKGELLMGQLHGFSTRNSVSYILAEESSDGVLDLNESTGSFSFYPNEGFTGAATFKFKLKDGDHFSQVAVATITVMDFVIQNLNFSTVKNTELIGTLQGKLLNHPEAVSYEIHNFPQSGGFNIDNTSGAFTFVPDPDFVGSTSFEFSMLAGGKAHEDSEQIFSSKKFTVNIFVEE